MFYPQVSPKRLSNPFQRRSPSKTPTGGSPDRRTPSRPSPQQFANASTGSSPGARKQPTSTLGRILAQAYEPEFLDVVAQEREKRLLASGEFDSASSSASSRDASPEAAIHHKTQLLKPLVKKEASPGKSKSPKRSPAKASPARSPVKGPSAVKDEMLETSPSAAADATDLLQEVVTAFDFIPEPPMDPEKKKLVDDFDEETADKAYKCGAGVWARMGTTQPFWPGVVAPDPDDLRDSKHTRVRISGIRVFREYHVQFFGQVRNIDFFSSEVCPQDMICVGNFLTCD